MDGILLSAFLHHQLVLLLVLCLSFLNYFLRFSANEVRQVSVFHFGEFHLAEDLILLARAILLNHDRELVVIVVLFVYL